MNANQLLLKLGFSANESKVYLAALQMGISSAQDIAEKAGVKRTTCYSVLSYLVNRGIVGKTKLKRKTKFIAEPPHRLLTLINEIEKGIKDALPELNAIYNKKEVKPKITFYEGNTSIQKVYDDTLIVKQMWIQATFKNEHRWELRREELRGRVANGIPNIAILMKRNSPKLLLFQRNNLILKLKLIFTTTKWPS